MRANAQSDSCQNSTCPLDANDRHNRLTESCHSLRADGFRTGRATPTLAAPTRDARASISSSRRLGILGTQTPLSTTQARVFLNPHKLTARTLNSRPITTTTLTASLAPVVLRTQRPQVSKRIIIIRNFVIHVRSRCPAHAATTQTPLTLESVTLQHDTAALLPISREPLTTRRTP